MASREPPWRRGGGRSPQRPVPPPTIPAKRTANSRHDHPAKRTANAQEDAWVADEDRFVLQQQKRGAAIRVKGGRAQPIDWLAVTLRFVDPTRNELDDEVEDHELEIVDPAGMLEGLSEDELTELEKQIDDFLTLETNRGNREYWSALKLICQHRRRKSRGEGRATSVVADDIDRILAPKSHEELEKLEKQIKAKLDSQEPIDYDYWDELLRTLHVWKAKATLRRVSQEVIGEQLQALRKKQQESAQAVQNRLYEMLKSTRTSGETTISTVAYDPALDPQPVLKLRAQEKSLERFDEKTWLQNIESERQKVLKLGYVPLQVKDKQLPIGPTKSFSTQPGSTSASRFAPVEKEDYSKATMALYEREVARGVEEGEEIFTAEEEVTSAKPQWATEYKPRKPRYFNRVQMGYEWNKYNQTHYDHDNPPPKVVQGYKFNIFYPDLIDKAKTPTYKIERENGRKRGQSFAPAGEDDTCLIRFIAGPPYQDIAFRIVDREWDYSARRDRGFTSTFDKGILQLHFKFKKIYYRK